MEAVGARAYTSHRQAGWVDWTTCSSLLLYLYLRPTEYCVLSIGGAAWATSQSTYSPPASQSQQPEIGLGSFFCFLYFWPWLNFFGTFVFLGPGSFLLLGLALDSWLYGFFRPLLIFLIFWPWLKPCARKREQRKKFSLKMMTCFVLNWTCSNLGEKVKRTKLEWTWCNSLDLLPIVFGMGGWGEGEKSGLLNVGWLVVVDLPLLHRPVPYQLQLAHHHQATRATRASTRAPPLVFHQATLPPWPAVQHPLHQRWKCLLVLPADSMYFFIQKEPWVSNTPCLFYLTRA